ncbi:hypothetical protein PLICRDRAFT_164957 [Plicaturopsis crispa FD-325 SS-3]|nr:hypothetical protein PLICRDRAFT_164957 [Plicaturopsis crispa FD-325 SS-3]
MKYSTVIAFALSVALADARPMRRADFTLKNGQDAIALNAQFAGLNANSPCTSGQNACVNSQFAQCVNGKFVTTGCAGGTVCAALPLVNSAGTSITCTTAADRDARIAATGAQGAAAAPAGSASAATSSVAAATSAKGGNNAAASSTAAATTKAAASASSAAPPAATSAAAAAGGDIQKSLTLDPSVINKGFAQDGSGNGAEAGQVNSLTSTNNFINFCASTKQALTDGKQVTAGSCNQTPMGQIPAQSSMPTAKFSNPKNMDTIPANKAFTISLNIQGMETGNFVNAATNYFSAPQQLNAQGQIIGHTHVVIEQMTSLTQTTPTDATKFAFFKGLNAKAANGVLTADVTAGLGPGVFRLSTINTAANHQPVALPVAQHGASDDMVYFTVQ